MYNFFLTRYFMPWTHKSAKNYHRSLILHMLPRAVFSKPSIVTSPQLICDVTRMRDTGIVTSYSSIVIARANWRKGDLHWSITAVNIDIPPPGIHVLACKKSILSVFKIFKCFTMTFLSPQIFGVHILYLQPNSTDRQLLFHKACIWIYGLKYMYANNSYTYVNQRKTGEIFALKINQGFTDHSQ